MKHSRDWVPALRALVLGIALWSSYATAEGRLLKEFLDSAVGLNFDQRIASETANQSAADYVTAWSALLPYFTVNGQFIKNQYNVALDFALKPGDPPTTVTISAAQQLEATFRVDLPLIYASTWFRAAAAGKLDNAAKENVVVMRDTVQRQVVAAYYTYAGSLALRESAKSSVEVAQREFELMQVRVTAGASTDLELLRAKAEVQRNLQALATAQVQVATAARSLAVLSGLGPAANIQLPRADFSSEPPLPTLEDRLPQVASNRVAREQSAAARHTSTAEWLNLVPTINSAAQERLTNAPGFNPTGAYYTIYVTANWRLDVPTFSKARSADANARIAALRESAAAIAARDQLRNDYDALQAAMVKVQAADAQVEATRAAQEMAKDRYALGAITQLDVITSDRDYYQALAAQIQELASLGVARASVRISSARPVE